MLRDVVAEVGTARVGVALSVLFHFFSKMVVLQALLQVLLRTKFCEGSAGTSGSGCQSGAVLHYTA